MIKNAFLQLIIVFVLFQGFSWFKELSMLPTQSTRFDMTNEPLSLPSITGQQVELLKSGSPAVLYFFAPWCHVCNLSIDNLEEIHRNNPQLHIVAVALDYNTRDEIANYVAKHQLNFSVVLGNSATKKRFNITAYPSYYVLDSKQVIQARSMGYSSEFGLYLRTLTI